MRHTASLLLACLGAGILIGASPPASARKKKAKTFVYLHEQLPAGGVVHGFVVDGAGGLTSVAGSPFATTDASSNCLGNCQSTAYSPDRTTLYVAGGNGVSAFKVAKTGVLALVPGSPFGGAATLGVATTRIGNKVFVYATLAGGPGVAAFSAAATGALTALPGGPFVTGPSPVGIDAQGSRVYVANAAGASITVFNLGGNGIPVAAAGSPFSVNDIQTVEATAFNSVFAGNPLLPAIAAFRTNSINPALVEHASSPFPTLVQPDGGLVAGPSNLMFAISHAGAGNNLQPWRDLGLGQLGAVGNPQDLGLHSVDLGAQSPDGKFLAAVASLADTLATYSVNPANGAVTAADTTGVPLENQRVNGIVFIKR